VTTDMRTWLNDVITEFVANSPNNSLKMEPDEKAWDEVLVGFSSGADPIYSTYKDVVDESHWTPLEAFLIQFPDVAVRSEDLTVISWILPQREATKADNRKETFYPSRRWVQARFPGEEFNNSLRLQFFFLSGVGENPKNTFWFQIGRSVMPLMQPVLEPSD
jgi:epoxyqueuosine reductase